MHLIPVTILAIALLIPGLVRANGDLIIEFEGFGNNRGTLAAALWNNKEEFLSRQHQPHLNFSGGIENNRVTWVIRDLAFGDYALSAFHDKNSNGELDSGLFGIPVEDYGFSNNARGNFGPPDYEDVRFEFKQSSQKQVIWIR